MNEITVSFFSNCSINKRRILSLENLFLRAEYAFFSCAKIITETRLKGAGIKRTTTLVTAAEHSIGNTEAPKSARKEIRNLLNDYEVYKNRMDELMEEIEETLSEIPYIDKLLEINGIGIKTVSCFIAEVGDIGRFDNPKQLQKLAGYAIVAESSGKHKGESRITEEESD